MVPDNQTDLRVNRLVSVCPNANLERIQRETVFGSYLAPRSGTTAHLSGALYDSDGILATGQYDPTGKLLGQATSNGTTTLQLPTGIWVNPEGSVYVSDTNGNGVVKFAYIL